MGACLATRRDVVERIGMMEEDYFLYSEDTDWCRRARHAGYSVVLSTRTALQHRQGTSAAKRPDFTFRQVFRSLLRYSRRHQSTIRRSSLSATIVADMLLRLPLYCVLGRLERARSALFVIRMMVRQDPDC
jgi:GT2 family glycosyltransferase